jgi:hypothetical protein
MAWIVVAALLGCSRRDPAEIVATARAAFAIDRGREIVTRGDRFVDPRETFSIPRRSGDPFRAGPIEIRPLAIEGRPGTLRDGAVAFAEVAASTDLVIAPRGDGVEEFRILRDRRAPTTFRWRLGLEGRTMRIREGRIEILEGDVVRLVSDPVVAVDAKGVRRALTVAIEGDELAATLDPAGLAYPIVVDPAWTTIGSMRTVRYQGFFAARLPDSRILVAGGQAPWVDVFDPTTNAWSAVADLPIPWTGAKGIELADGRVLAVAGGESSTAYARYEPSTQTWTTFGTTQATVCNGCALVRLNDGRVLKVPNGVWPEIYDPQTARWTTLPQLAQSITRPVAVTLADGRVFVQDTVTGQATRIYTPRTGEWTAGPNAPFRQTGPSAVRLNDGRVLVVSQLGGSGLLPQVALLFDPAKNAWDRTWTIGRIRANAALTLMPSGRVLATGGEQTGTSSIIWADAEIYDPATNGWTLIDPMANRRAQHVAALLPGSGVLVAGGVTDFGSPTSSAERYAAIADGASCVAPNYPVACASGYCVDGVCCQSSSCPGGRCDVAGAGRPPGTCSKNLGQSCTEGSDCSSGFCADGVCCNSACSGTCEACNLAGTVGTCAPVVGKPIHGTCSGSGPCAATCDGINRASCVFAPSGTIACGTASCAGGIETRASTCDGKGGCPQTTAPCGAYACGASACKRSCAVEADCSAGNYCLGDQCVPKVGLGSSCTSSPMCPTGLFCTDGVCCGVDDCGEGRSCSAGKKGECSKIRGAACATDAECASGFCTDGVCCDRRCDAQCEACDQPATRGTCSPVSGAPRGARPACEGDVCGKKACDGAKDPTACVAFANGGTTVCAPARCEGATLIPQSTCDGAGTCATPPKASCGKYACDGATLACRTKCRGNDDCATGFFCVAEVCSEGARCSDDRTKSISTDGLEAACAPFLCGTDGTCLRSCAVSTDCASGNICDVATARCVPAASSDDGGGCAFGRRGGSGLVVLAAIAAFLGRRRARTES